MGTRGEIDCSKWRFKDGLGLYSSAPFQSSASFTLGSENGFNLQKQRNNPDETKTMELSGPHDPQSGQNPFSNFDRRPELLSFPQPACLS
jgi:hypothetical protein